MRKWVELKHFGEAFLTLRANKLHCTFDACTTAGEPYILSVEILTEDHC